MQDLGDLFGGQGHRQQFTHAAASVRAGPTTIPRSRHGPRPPGNQPNGPAAASASSSTHQRAGSPTAHGTIRDVGGQRQAIPMPNRHREPARDGSFVGPIPGAPRIPPRQLVLPTPEIPQIPGAPRLAPVQPVLQVPQTLLLTPTQPFSQVPLASDLPAPLRINRAPQQSAAHARHQASNSNQATPQPANGPVSSGPADRDQQRINTISDAIGTDRLLLLMARDPQDGSHIFSAKVHVRDCAVKTSEPSIMVISKGPLWVAIFHAVRKALITLAIEIALMADEDGLELIRLTNDEYLDFDRLFCDVLDAISVVKDSIQFEQAVQDKWTSDGKKDILDQVIEKDAAYATEMERESNSQSPSSGNEAEMTIQVETSIQQSSELFNLQMPTAQQYGLYTTITGPATPVRKTVHFTPTAESESVIISDGDDHWAVSRKEMEPDQLPPGVITRLSLDFEPVQHLNSDDLPGAYVAALKAAADVLNYTPKAEFSDEEL